MRDSLPGVINKNAGTGGIFIPAKILEFGRVRFQAVQAEAIFGDVRVERFDHWGIRQQEPHSPFPPGWLAIYGFNVLIGNVELKF